MHLVENRFMRLLIGCLLVCSSISAQVSFPTKDSSIIKEIDLPFAEPFDTAKKYQRVAHPFIYLSSDNDLYNYFGYETAVKYRELTFKDFHILGIYACRQCLEVCHHGKDKSFCHRNLCENEWIWVMRDNKKAFTEVPLSPNRGRLDFPVSKRPFFGDTVVRAMADTGLSRWYTTGRGDCFASFEYNLYKDNFHPVLLLQERNFWGGCRAGGSFDHTLSFVMPKDITYTIKNRILMEKKYD